jgi:uncharacterized protein
MFRSLYAIHQLPDLMIILIVAATQVFGARILLRNTGPRWRRPILIATGVSLALLLGAHLLNYEGIERHAPSFWRGWGRGMIMLWAFLSVLWMGAYQITRLLPRASKDHSPARRGFLRAAQVAIFGVPTFAAGYGVFIQRFKLTLREQRIEIPNLPEPLRGMRLVQLTDIHLSAFLSERELAQAVAMANETKAHVALVTGDLISSFGDPLDAALAQVSKLRADLGIFGCMGNHERYVECENYTEREGARLGVQFLRGSRAKINFQGADLNLVGVDYQRFNRPYLVRAEKLIDPSAFNVLLSHNPDVFPIAARKGFPLTIAGHTHGGQVRFEILEQDLNIARFFTPYVDGLYREGDSSIFVSRGIGTIGLPARLGAPPEVALITLWPTSS